VANLTGHHVHFIGVCHRQHKVYILGTGLGQYLRGGRVALNGAYIEPILHGLQKMAIAVNDGYVILFPGQDFGDG